jgi:hypothetical protein
MRPGYIRVSVHRADRDVGREAGTARRGAGGKLLENLCDDFLEVADCPGDGGLVNAQQFADHFFGDVVLEIRDGHLFATRRISHLFKLAFA